jgi:hypothetical protein
MAAGGMRMVLLPATMHRALPKDCYMPLSTGFSSRIDAYLQTCNVRSPRKKMLQIPMDMGWSPNFPNSKMHSEPVIKKAAPTNAALVHLPQLFPSSPSTSKAKARRSQIDVDDPLDLPMAASFSMPMFGVIISRHVSCLSYPAVVAFDRRPAFARCGSRRSRILP